METKDKKGPGKSRSDSRAQTESKPRSTSLKARLEELGCRSPVRDGFQGVNIGIARGLLQAGLPHMARAYEMLADMHYLGKIISRQKFFSELAGPGKSMSFKAARTAYDELAGRFGDGHRGKNEYKEYMRSLRKRFLELLPNIVPKDIAIGSTIFGTNSKRGRPSTSWVYVPTEYQMQMLLQTSGLVYGVVQADFSKWCFKPREVMRSNMAYKDFIMAQYVFEGGKDQYGRSEIARRVGRHPNTARKGSERIGITVTTNPPIRRLISPEHDCSLPADKNELSQWIKERKGRVGKGTHIETELGRKFRFTQAGAKDARAASLKAGGFGTIYRVDYDMSTYDPRTSPYWIEKNRGSRSRYRMGSSR